MKKVLNLALIFMPLFVLSISAAADEATPVKLSLFPPLSVPGSKIVHGVDFAVISSIVDETQGVQWTWIYGRCSEKMVGAQFGFIAKTKEITGVQNAFYRFI